MEFINLTKWGLLLSNQPLREGGKRGFVRRLSRKTVLMCVPRVPPRSVGTFWKPFLTRSKLLPMGPMMAVPNLGIAIWKNIKNNFFQKLHPMIPAKAEILLINVDQLPRQEIRRPGSDVWDLNLNYSISYLNIYIYIDIDMYKTHSRHRGQKAIFRAVFI